MAGASDRVNYYKAEDYFEGLDGWGGPEEIVEIIEGPPKDISDPNYWRGITLKFKGGELCVIQFIRPTMWRVRFDPVVRDPNEYGDLNTRTIVGDYTSTLIRDLDKYSGIEWTTKLEPLTDGYWVFKSIVTSIEQHTSGNYQLGEATSIFLHKKRFRIQATRVLKPVGDSFPIPIVTGTAVPTVKNVWQTSEQTFRYKLDPDHNMIKNIVLDVIKAGPGEFIGWGEQGGTSFMKESSMMNYFNPVDMDNMQYQQVYNGGPLDQREPLYHSDPFWLDVNSNPEHMNITATFIDNYSQIAVDLGKSNAGYTKVGTKFGAMDFYIISADTVGDIIRLYTGIIGRSALKPRYILGNHQSCYGYMNRESLHAVINYYRAAKIPLDGLHIDVPFQNNYRTFTIDEKNFPKPQEMFDSMKKDGVKCCTNITPVISTNDLGGDGYKTLREGRDNGYFLMDHRYTTGVPEDPNQVEYMCYRGGNRDTISPSNSSQRPRFTDDSGNVYHDNYPFDKHYNSGTPYHGGVSYGYDDGTPGHYADLNRKDVRKWWGTQYKHLFDMGLEFVWQDMTTPAIHESYGDMKGLPSRLKLNIHRGMGTTPVEQLAIENWALYSYNLHKATFHGLNHLESRDNKRNFILGRGSFAGMYRYAGLWSGDNASTWDFWRITVPQVLSVGLNGVCISGSDTGGFEPSRGANGKEDKYCDPELLIRWYAGSTLLPWIRNHYVSRTDKNTGEMRKWFQEPYAYPIHFETDRKTSNPLLVGQAWLYYGVQHITQYYLQLRYTLIQYLYDAMFDNQIYGLPIARSMIVTDPQDTTLYNRSQRFLDNQYMAAQDILVAPIMHSRWEKGHEKQIREIYFPLGYYWYPSNLRPLKSQRVALEPALPPGRLEERSAKIPEYPDHPHEEGKEPKPDPNGYPFIVPMFIREGSIIPQIEARDYIGDGIVNPIEFNIYPHVITEFPRSSKYTTYLDDGVSSSSAPEEIMRIEQIYSAAKLRGLDITPLKQIRRDEYRAVTITQDTAGNTRTISITRKLKAVDYDPAKEIGMEFSILLWYDPYHFKPGYSITITPAVGVEIEKSEESELKAVVLKVKETLGTTEKIIIKVEGN